MSVQQQPQSSGQIEQSFRRLIDEAFARQEFAILEEAISPNIVEHQPGMGTGPEGVRDAIAYLHGAFPDFRITVEDLVVDGDTIWARMRATGTHEGPLMGIPPTGKAFDITVLDVCRFENGKMVEHWGVPDRFSQLQQLGLLPRPKDRT